MFLICPDPFNFDSDWKKHIVAIQNEPDAIREAKTMAHTHEKAMIYRLESFHVPVGTPATAVYTINAKGEILPKV